MVKMVKILGQEVDKKLLLAYTRGRRYIYGYDDDETCDWDSMVGLEHLNENVALQIIDCRFLRASQKYELTARGKTRVEQLTQRAIIEGYTLDMIISELCDALFKGKSPSLQVQAIFKKNAPKRYKSLISDVDYSKTLVYCVRCYKKYNQPMVKSAGKV